MARLGRGQPGYRSGHSVLSPPSVIDAPVAAALTEPISVSLASEHTSRQLVSGRRASHYELRAPVALFDAVVWHGPGVKLAPPLADTRRRDVQATLRPPAVVAPAVSTDVFSGPRVELARAKPGDPRRKAQYDLAAPIVVFPGGQMGGVGVSLADSRNARSDGRRAPNSRLSPPTVVAAAAAFVADPIRVYRAEPHQPARSRYQLRAPSVVAPAVTYRPVAVALTEPHKPAPTHPELRPPAVVDPAVTYRPVQTHLVPSHRPAPTRSDLRAPTALDPAVTYAPVRPSLAEARKPRLVQSDLRPPTVIDTPAQPPVDVSVDVTLAPSRDIPRRLGKSELRAPAVVGPAIVYPSVATTFAPSPRQARAAHPLLLPLPIAGAAFVAPPLTANLAPSSNLARRTHPKLRAPVVLDPAQVYGPLDVKLAPSPRQARGTHYRLRAPAVVAPAVLYRPVAVTLVARTLEMLRHRSIFRLRAPAVVTALSDVIYIDYYDHPRPLGILSSSPQEDEYGKEDVSSQVSSRPATDEFDPPMPIGEPTD